MDKQTYEALKRVINGTVKNEDIEFEDIEKVVEWIDEVEKEYSDVDNMELLTRKEHKERHHG